MYVLQTVSEETLHILKEALVELLWVASLVEFGVHH
jgi:hypothetical protein